MFAIFQPADQTGPSFGRGTIAVNDYIWFLFSDALIQIGFIEGSADNLDVIKLFEIKGEHEQLGLVHLGDKDSGGGVHLFSFSPERGQTHSCKRTPRRESLRMCLQKS